VKHLTTGEGGMVTTDDAEHARRLRTFRNHGIDGDLHVRQARGEWQYEMSALGFNYRLTDIGSALGLSQLPRLEANVARRRAIAARYGRELSGLAAIRLPVTLPGVEPAWHLYPIQLDGVDRDRAFRALRAEGIGVNVHYGPVHLHRYYRERFGFAPGACPHAEAAAARLLSLPMFHAMTDRDVEDVVTAVTKVVTGLQ
jgi:perosamine synthetase